MLDLLKILLLLLPLGLPFNVFSSPRSVLGSTYPIIEEDFLQTINAKWQKKIESGEWAQWQALEYAISFCQGLDNLHKKGLTHGDLNKITHFWLDDKHNPRFLDLETMRRCTRESQEKQEAINKDVKNFLTLLSVCISRSPLSTPIRKKFLDYAQQSNGGKNIKLSELIEFLNKKLVSIKDAKPIASSLAKTGMGIMSRPSKESDSKVIQSPEKRSKFCLTM